MTVRLERFERLALTVSSTEPHFLDPDQLVTLERFFDAHVCAPPFLRQASSCFMQLMCLPSAVLKNIVGLMCRHLEPRWVEGKRLGRAGGVRSKEVYV